MNIRVYKTVSPRDTVNFTIKSKDGRGSTSVGSIGEIAGIVKRRLHRTLKGGAEQVSIDFTPFHNIEWTSTLLEPKRCLPLSVEEQEVFWLYFSKK